MLTGPDCLVVLYMPCDGTQDDLLHQLPRHRERPAFLDPFAPQDCLPRDCDNQAPKQAKVCPPKFQGSKPRQVTRTPNSTEEPLQMAVSLITLRATRCRGLAKQPQLPQPLPISLVLQTLHQLRCPSLDTLQPLNVSLVVGGPKLNTVFEAAFQPLFPKPVALHGVVVTQVQDLALGLVKPHTIDLSPSIQPVQVPLQSLPALKQINTPTQLGVVCKLSEGALDPLVQIIDRDIKQNWPQY
ncbi:hypothetical protein QYF61_011540 [Mycteria americana]|uniref:Uncharacterized protein n=1 Tax=Mycteria americana TaxID=33587 RepID=A0AAN7NS79_MYCAM|nr:hypothetical protein QYF61_011540 [Mycteria americana]